ncbi:MAG TPA: tetratricopeptide repeat protein [Usitatibacter sp.]|nr:tetratricopeptide repeat protein [Usitatibacter sp.]
MRFRMWWYGALATLAWVATPAMADDDEADDATEAIEVDESSASADAVFDFLVAEIAAQRGDLEGALAIYDRMARELRDPQVARRAVEAAIRARAYGPALEAAALLLELEPGSTLAREIIAALLVNEGDIAKARATLSALLDKNRNRGPMLMQLPHLFAKYPDKAAVMESTRLVAERYPEMAEAHYAIGVAALLANNFELGGREADAALAIRPDWEQGAILKAQALRKVSPEAVLAFYRDFVASHPQSIEVRMQLGRELASERQLAEAREQFREVERLSPKDSQPAYAIGLLSLQLEEPAEAQIAFTRALKLGYREPAAIYLGLGQAAEGLKRFDEAIAWYQKVESSDWVRAQLKVATLIARQQGLEAGREYLRKIEPRSGEDRVQVIQVEAQLLRDARAWQQAFDLLSESVDQFPDSYELLYDRAMAAERLDRIDVLEKDLRRVIRMKPDYAHAYNALGYTLVERTNRLDEARDLIEKAHKLAPDDPFIMDSLGWVLYRLGQVDDALKHLHAAYNVRNDPEIAAHLGEVLWKAGQRDEAQKIWRAALTQNPDHETLITVMQKYRP